MREAACGDQQLELQRMNSLVERAKLNQIEVESLPFKADHLRVEQQWLFNRASAL
jgi:hypothetical protein